MLINSHEQIAKMQTSIIENAEKTLAKMRVCISTMTTVEFFATIKFEKIGADPVTGEAINFIEQLNQMYSDLVVLAAASDLLDLYPQKHFNLQLGATSGFDVQSTDGQIVAECFAATSVASNDKMNKDCKKLLRSAAEHKYIYFCTYLDDDKKLCNRYKKYPEIHFKRIQGLASLEKVPM